MEQLYPPGPVGVAEDLTAPGPSYRSRARIAFLSLLLFIALYFSLTGWFAWTTYKYFHDATTAGGGTLLGWAMCAVSAFLTVFLVKALFFVNRGGETNDIEVTAEEEPALFDFLHRLADEAGAPRPHRVFLSPRVNAAVFYDLTLLNLLIPSKKNLEIGLALVNALTLGELKAVLAHEFGHFRQGSMAVGRWVYVAQQVATHIIHQRDILDNFLMGLSRIDIRIAWIGWLLRLIVWSLRALLDTVFSLVVIAQRSLSREMEFHADMVSVSLTGSDALVHALHRLHAADDAWERALSVAAQEVAEGRAVTDIFVIQRIITQRMKDILDDENYDTPPPLPEEQPEAHRVFDSEDVHPPQMWSTHPPNRAREDNAKKHYIPAPVDDRPAWSVFADPQSLRSKMTEHILSGSPNAAELAKSELTETVACVNKVYTKAIYERRYRGAYMGRSAVREYAEASDLFPVEPTTDVAAGVASIYPHELVDKLEHWKNVEEERANLRALYDGTLSSPDGVMRHRGKILKRRQMPATIRALALECDEARNDVCEHDRLVRGVHRAAAESLGDGWREYHTSLVALLHYADHSEANLADAQGKLANLWAVVIADGKVSSGEIKQLLVEARDLYTVLHDIDHKKTEVALSSDVAARMGTNYWQQVLNEEFSLPMPTRENIGDWLGVVDGWINYFLGALSALRMEALESLLATEAQIAHCATTATAAGDPPTPARVPSDYATLVPGTERKLQTRLGAWDRFQTADGFVPGLARFTVAAAIVGGLLGFGQITSGTASITIYNGLATSIEVVADGEDVIVGPWSYAEIAPHADADLELAAYTRDGRLVESTVVDASNALDEYVYNVAGAAPMIEWTAVYGSYNERPPRYLGSTRFFSSDADYLFEEPPEEIRSGGDGGARTVLSGFGEVDPRYLDDYLPEGVDTRDMVRMHASWDNATSDNLLVWLSLASTEDGFDTIIDRRIERDVDEVIARRFEQDYAKNDARREQVCEEHRQRANGSPSNADWQYLAIRCVDDDEKQDIAFLAAYEEAPEHGWLAGAAGFTYAERQDWEAAEPALVTAYRRLKVMRPSFADTIARVRRMRDGIDGADVSDVFEVSPWLQMNVMLEDGAGLEEPSLRAYQLLADGDLDAAVEEARDSLPYADEILRLAAASDGASDTIVTAALALGPDQAIDGSTIWAALGLAARHDVPLDALFDRADAVLDDDAPMARAFLVAIDSPQFDAETAESLLVGASPQIRGHALSMGVVALGNDAPAEWRDSAVRLLFPTERPYFRN